MRERTREVVELEEFLTWLACALAEYALAKLLDWLLTRLREQKAPKAGKHFRGL